MFDVGHQCYTHKMLTGRADQMDTLRKLGISGFPKPYESNNRRLYCGPRLQFRVGGPGNGRARPSWGQNYRVVALIGDGALTGGLAYEGLSDAGDSGEKLLVILNDNGMSIKKNVGGIATLLYPSAPEPRISEVQEQIPQFLRSMAGGRKVYDLTHRIKKDH